MSMIDRFLNYYRVWRSRGLARMDHGLWLHWALFGRYPKQKADEAVKASTAALNEGGGA